MLIVNNVRPYTIQSWDEQFPGPDDCAIWDKRLDTALFYQYNGIVTLNVVDGIVVSYSPDVEEWEAWNAEQAKAEEPAAPTLEDRVASLEENITVLNIVLTGEGPTE